MKSLLRIIAYSISIIILLLPIITIITHYYVFATGQLADGVRKFFLALILWKSKQKLRKSARDYPLVAALQKQSGSYR